jgi:hypothetical protein
LFDGHAPGIHLDNLFGGQGEIRGDEEVPGFLISLAPENDEVQGFLFLRMVEDSIALNFARFDGKGSEEPGSSLEIDDDFAWGSQQKRNALQAELAE